MRLKALKTIAAALAIAGLGSAAAFALPQPSKNPHPGTTTASTGTTSTTATTATAPAPTAPPTTAAHGKPPKSGVGCAPTVSLVIKGWANADVGAGSTLQVNVTGGNRYAKPLVGSLVTVTTTASTRVRNGQGNSISLSSIKKGNKVLVRFRDCRADLAHAKTAAALTTIVQTPLTPTSVVRLGH
jgi:hypothetical protein